MDALGMKIMSPIYLLKDWNLSFEVKDFVVEYLVNIIRIKLPNFHLMDTSCEGLIDFTSWIEHLKCASTTFLFIWHKVQLCSFGTPCIIYNLSHMNTFHLSKCIATMLKVIQIYTYQNWSSTSPTSLVHSQPT